MEGEDFMLLDRGSKAVRDEEFQALALRAEAAGWTPGEIAAAMVALGEKYVAVRTGQISGSGNDQGEATDF